MTGSEIYLKFKTWVEDRATVALNGLLNTTNRLGGVGQKVIGSLSGAFGGLEGAVGKTVGAIGNIAGAVASLGMIGGTFVAAQVAISIWADKAKKAVEDFQDAVDKMAKRVKERYDDVNKRRLNGVADELKKATTYADRAAKAFDAMANAYARVADAKGQTEKSGHALEIAQMELDKSDAMGAAGEDARALVEADHNILIAKRKLEHTISENEASVKMAQDDEKKARTSLGMARDRVAAAEKALAKAKAEEAMSEEADKKSLGQFRAQREAAEAALAAALNDQTTKEADLAVATEKVQQATIGAASAKASAQTQLQSAYARRSDIADQQSRKDEEAIEKKIEEERKESEKTNREYLKISAKEEESRVVQEANEKLDGIKKEIEKANRMIEAGERDRREMETGMAADAAHHGGISGRGYNYWSRNSDGALTDLGEIGRAERYAARERRDRAAVENYKDTNRYGRELERALELSVKRDEGKSLRKDEQNFLDRFNKRERMNDGMRKAADAKADAEAREKKIRDQMASDVKKIREKLMDALEAK